MFISCKNKKINTLQECKRLGVIAEVSEQGTEASLAGEMISKFKDKFKWCRGFLNSRINKRHTS